MLIGLNAMDFRQGRIGGVETYFRNLVDYLQKIDEENTFCILCDNIVAKQFKLVSNKFNIKICAYRKSPFRKISRDILIKTLGVDVLRVDPEHMKFDLIHHPFSTVKKEWSHIPSVLTFWDMQQEFYPEFFPPDILKSRRETYKASTRIARRVITGSNFTRDSLIEKYDVPANKIDVVYPGYGPDYKVCSDPSLLKTIAKKYKLDRSFLFYPAATWPHKNHKILLEALRLMIDRHGFDGELVLTGAAMHAQKEILALIDKLGLEKFVRILGFLQNEDLPYLYNLARLLVFPSLFEGFGLPLVEAMACGCPVVCSNAASIPEVVGDAGLLFDPNSSEDMADKVWSVWVDDEKREHIKIAGFERVKRFNWETTARKTIDVYRKILG
jgi:glycosyltransferase involved in cell wall biosynthesis